MNAHDNPEFLPVNGPARLGKIALGKKLGLQSGDALLVVDAQRDFLPGGALAVTGGDAIIPRLNAYLAAFSTRQLPIFLSRDWHPRNHCSFKSHGGTWPEHCVQHTLGADWPERLRIPTSAHVISKGTDAVVETYSAFAGTTLLELLRQHQVHRLFVAGPAGDYCVHDTVLVARAQGFDVILLVDAMAAVSATPGDATRAIRDMVERGASVFNLAGPRVNPRSNPDVCRK